MAAFSMSIPSCLDWYNNYNYYDDDNDISPQKTHQKDKRRSMKNFKTKQNKNPQERKLTESTTGGMIETSSVMKKKLLDRPTRPPPLLLSLCIHSEARWSWKDFSVYFWVCGFFFSFLCGFSLFFLKTNS